MTKKKSSPKAPAKQAPKPPAKKNNKTIWIIGVIAVVAVAVGFAASNKTKGPDGAPKPTAEEAKYVGRFLPEGYTEPKIGDAWTIAGSTQMTPVTAESTDKGPSIAVSDVTTNKIVSFEYTKADGEKIPLLAYLKPSGKVQAAVSYCVPCKGTGQSLESDGTMTCQSCGTKRDVESGVGLSGACKLYPLDEIPVKVEGDKIVLDKAVLDNWTVQPLDRQVG